MGGARLETEDIRKLILVVVEIETYWVSGVSTKDPARRFQGQRWHEPDDKKYNPSRHEMNQDHGHAEGCRIKP